MRILLCLIFVSTCLFPGCQNSTAESKVIKPVKLKKLSKEDHFKRVEEIAATLKANADKPLDRNLAQELIDQSKSYAAQNVYDKKNNAAFLFRAGEVARSIRKYEEAISLFGQVYTNFPENPLAIKARFLEAYTFEDGVNDKEKAKELYQTIVDNYPGDPLAEQSKQLLMVIDKSPEELVKEFQKKNKQ